MSTRGPSGCCERSLTSPTALRSRLREPLERLYRDFDRREIVPDPVQLVHRFASPADREVVAFCASALAFGRVASVLESVSMLLRAMGPRPAEFVRAFAPARDSHGIEPITHRWIRGNDLCALMAVLQRMLREAGSIEAFFLEGDDPSAADIGPALESFSRRALEFDLREYYGPHIARPGVRYFFPRPSAGSACKRLNLFLRWMVRHDTIDLGVWTGVSPARLVVPLDVHVVRLARCLRLTRYRSPGWKMAADITASLRRIDLVDPIRYDFSLCHVGMMRACGFDHPLRDRNCPLRGLCRPLARPRGGTSRQSAADA